MTYQKKKKKKKKKKKMEKIEGQVNFSLVC